MHVEQGFSASPRQGLLLSSGAAEAFGVKDRYSGFASVQAESAHHGLGGSGRSTAEFGRSAAVGFTTPFCACCAVDAGDGYVHALPDHAPGRAGSRAAPGSAVCETRTGGMALPP